MKVLGFILAFCGVACIVPSGSSTVIFFAPLFFYGAYKCFSYNPPLPPVNPNQPRSGDAFSGGYEGSTHGRFEDIGGGQVFDRDNPDDIVDGVNWRPDGYGGYVGPNGQSIDNNNDNFRFHDSSDDEDDNVYHGGLRF